MLPELHAIDFEELETTTDEVLFVCGSFYLLKEASIFLAAVAGIRTEGQTDGLSRNHVIVIGHYARMIKLTQTLSGQMADGHGGDQQIAVSREFTNRQRRKSSSVALTARRSLTTVSLQRSSGGRRWALRLHDTP